MAIFGREQAQQILSNLGSLGPRRLGALGIIGLLVVGIVGLSAYYFSRPDLETLYSGLDRSDVTQMSAALSEAGIPYDVNPKGDTIMTPFSQTASARMLLAEAGLPRSDNAGYELFDKMGSIGLTSFMQQVTRVRALEGEIARTIQTLKDVRAARVHIVLPDEGSFRREKQPPSASVVIRTENTQDFKSAEAIRHLVAAAVPGMTVNEVTVLSTDGTLLASGDDSTTAAPSKLFGMEKIVSRSIEDQIRHTLAPYLGVGNFQSSVTARLNTDRKQTDETIFDPDSRVERSTRSVKDTTKSNNSTTEDPATVNQNIPQAQPQPGGSGKTSTEDKEHHEDLTNYELNEKKISTVSDGYSVERLSVAVVVNRTRLKETLGPNATDMQIDGALKDIQGLIASAAGFSEKRGDQIKVTAVDFISNGSALEPVPGPGFAEMFMRQSGTLINALTALVVVVLLIWFGLKPAIRAIASTGRSAAAQEAIELQNAMAGETGYEGPAGLIGASSSAGGGLAKAGMDAELLEDLTRSQRNSPQARLEKLIDFDEAQAAQILKQWIHQKEAA